MPLPDKLGQVDRGRSIIFIITWNKRKTPSSLPECDFLLQEDREYRHILISASQRVTHSS